MNKDELFDVIVRAFGVAFLFLAIMGVPKLLECLVSMAATAAMPFYTPENETSSSIRYLLAATRPALISQSVGAIIRVVIFIIASINFLRGGSWVKLLMNRQTYATPSK